MLLAVHDIKKSFLDVKIVDGASFHVDERDKVALIGPNGAGKTTLLKIIAGELLPDGGQVVLAKDKSFGYLAQNQSMDSPNTIYDELLSVKAGLIELEEQISETELLMKDKSGAALDKLLLSYERARHDYEYLGGYTFRSEIGSILKGLGFGESEHAQPVSTLSGGQKTRIALAKLLLKSPDLLLLDEPTNHLDLSAVDWLEDFLQSYRGALLIVSHDRYFLDRSVHKVVELKHKKTRTFTGNYSAYVEKSEQLSLEESKAFSDQQKDIARQEAVIVKLRQFGREKHMKRAKSREKALAKVEVLSRPQTDDEMRLLLKPSIQSGMDVLQVEGLTKAYGPLSLFNDVHFDIRRGEHIALIGDNGTGKTTLLKILNGVVAPDAGSFRLGANVHVGYFDQEHAQLNPNNSLMMEISDAYPQMANAAIRNMLAAFLFVGDDVHKHISELSGGERGRLSLAKLMLSSANFLILDEPTNHLDLGSTQILEAALNRYTGTLLYVSHDRYFINRTASRILDLCDKRIVNYIGQSARGDDAGDAFHGSFDYYREKKEALAATTVQDGGKNAEGDSTVSEAKADYWARKEERAAERKRAAEIRRLEEKIAAREGRLKAIEAEMSMPELASNAEELMRLMEEKTRVEAGLLRLYEKWEALAD